MKCNLLATAHVGRPCMSTGSFPGQVCCRKGEPPYRAQRAGSCLTLGKELSEETHVLTKQEILLGRAPGWRAGGSGNPGELLCRVARSLGFYGDGLSFRVVFGQSFSFRVFPGGARIAQPRWMLARGILGSGQTRGVSF